MAKPLLLLVDDDVLISETLSLILSRDFEVHVAASRLGAIELMRKLFPAPELALVDLGLPPVPHEPTEGFALIGALLAHNPAMKVLVLSGQDEDGAGRQARALGATDFVAKPANPAKLRAMLLAAFTALQAEANSSTALSPVTRPMALRQPVFTYEPDTTIPPHPAPGLARATAASAPGAAPIDPFAGLIGVSAAVQTLKSQLATFADSPFPVLLEGESGAGKEIAASALQQKSNRRDKPFLALNCAAISPNLVEPTLFGYAKGAFTGALGNKAGYFEDAAGGTLLLDEIGELPLELQAKLLRVLENGEFNRVGETQSRRSQARIVAATNRDLRQEVKQGRFRADLYHRLSVFTVRVPPLRELGDDKLALLTHFSALYSSAGELKPFTLDETAARVWLRYPFPGNVRELRNIVIRLSAKFPGRIISAAELEPELDWVNADEGVRAPVATSDPAAAEPDSLAHIAVLHLSRPGAEFRLDATLSAWERAYVDAALKMAHGNVSHAARLLGVNRTTLYSRMTILHKA